MQIELTPTLLAVILSGAITLAAMAAAWGTLRAQLKSVIDHLAPINGRLDKHDDELIEQGKHVAHLEGVLPHSSGGGGGGGGGDGGDGDC